MVSFQEGPFLSQFGLLILSQHNVFNFNSVLCLVFPCGPGAREKNLASSLLTPIRWGLSLKLELWWFWPG